MSIEHIRAIKETAKMPKQKKVYSIPRKSAKKIEQEKSEKNLTKVSDLEQWFLDRRLEMTGKCVLCGCKTEKNNDATYKRSIHHLLEKRPSQFPSVAIHKDNWVELCYYGNFCHQNIHNGNITWELILDSKKRDLILAKVEKVIPFIAEKERRLIPNVLKDIFNLI